MWHAEDGSHRLLVLLLRHVQQGDHGGALVVGGVALEDLVHPGHVLGEEIPGEGIVVVGGVAVLRGEGRAATSAGEVGREGARRRGAEKWRVSRAGDREREERRRARRAVRDASRVAGRTREAHARGAGGDGRQRTTATRTGETRASRTVTEPRTTMRPPTERCCAASAGVGATPPRTWRTATLLKLDARRRNMATRRLSRQSAAVGARGEGTHCSLGGSCMREAVWIGARSSAGEDGEI